MEKKAKQDLQPSWLTGDDVEIVDPHAASSPAPAVPADNSVPVQTQSGGAATVKPFRSPIQKMKDRFLGNDVPNDPHPYYRMLAQMGLSIPGGIYGAEAGAAAGGAVGSAVPVLGTAIGAAAGAVVGGIAGSVGGTMLGAAAPEMMMEGAEFIGIKPKDFRERNGLSNEDLKTVLEGEALLDAATGGGIVLARTVGRKAIKFMSGIGPAERQMADEAAKMNVNMLPVQIGKRQFPRFFVNVMGKFPIVAGTIRSRMMTTESAYKEAFAALPAEIAPMATMSSVSREVMMQGKTQFTNIVKHFNKEYTDVFKQAEGLGIKINPEGMAGKAKETLDEIKRLTPAAVRKTAKGTPRQGPVPADFQELSSFINTNLSPIFRTTKSGATTIAPQSFEQMDNILVSIDHEIGRVGANGGSSRVINMLQGIKQSIQADMLFKTVAPPGANPQQVQYFAAKFRELDKAYTETMATMYETTAAKRFGTVKRGGLRGSSFDPETKTNMDNLADILMRGQVADDLVDLHKIIPHDTFTSLASTFLDQKLNKAWRPVVERDGHHMVDIDVIRRELGFNNPKGKIYEHTAKLLELSGGLKMSELDNMLKMGEKLKSVDIPNASTFIQRRATMGGVGAIMGGILMTDIAKSHPGAAGTGLIGMAMMLGGSHFLGRMVTDPLAARSLRYAIKGGKEGEVRKVINKAAFLRAVQITIRGGVDGLDFTEEQGMNLWSWFKQGAEYITTHDPAINAEVPNK